MFKLSLHRCVKISLKQQKAIQVLREHKNDSPLNAWDQGVLVHTLGSMDKNSVSLVCICPRVHLNLVIQKIHEECLYAAEHKENNQSC